MKQENIDAKQQQLFDVEIELANPDLLLWKEPVLKKRKLLLETQLEYLTN